MHHNFLFDLDQTLLDFHASEYKALGIVLRANGLSFSDKIYQAFKAYNKSLWLELEKGNISRAELFTKRFLDVFSRCEGDASGLDPLEVNDEFIRTMSVNGVLMDGALEFVRKLRKNIPDARIYIASNGGEVDSGFELIDIIESSVTPIWTVNLGYAYSMGFLIMLAGHQRYALRNAKFLMHDGSNFVWDSGTKAQDKMDFQRKVEARIREYVIAHSKVTAEEYDSKLRVEWYLFADEAKEKGFVDFIVGEDCGLSAVI